VFPDDPAVTSRQPGLSWLEPAQATAALTAILTHGGDCVEILGSDGMSRYLGPAGRPALGIGTDEDVAGHAWLDAWVMRAAAEAAFEAAKAGTMARMIGAQRKPSTWWDVTLVPLGTDAPILALSRNVTERRLLLIEMQHRVKNALAVAQAMSTQTLRRATDPAAASEALAGRISALAAAQDLLSPDRWADGTIAAVAARTVSAYDESRFQISGPAWPIAARAGISLWMALHELGTNAVKYGALSNADGKVSLSWTIDQNAGRLSMHWREQGGPSVVEPTVRGFGTRLIQDALAAELGGQVTMDYAPDGLDVAITGKLARIAPEPAP
jgi:two-component sensor histidine kinase